MLRSAYLVLLSAFWLTQGLGQRDIPLAQQDFLESLLQDIEVEGNFDFNAIFDHLQYYQQHPININTANSASLKDLWFVSDLQIQELLTHRKRTGDFLALEELQSLDSFSDEFIQALLPFITIDKSVNDYQVPVSQMLLHGHNELFIRWQRTLQTAQAFTEEVNENSRFLGDPNKWYLRYQHSYENRLSYGVTAEKDIGEPFFQAPNTTGFDFYSAHFFLRAYNQKLKAVALGDYSLTLGQGLIINTGFGFGKSNSTTTIKKDNRPLRPYRSVNEAGFLRGAATTIALNEVLTLTAFTSYRARDTNLLDTPATSISGETVLGFSSILNAGFHRNLNELANKNTIRQFTTGGNLTYQNQYFQLGFTGVFDQFNRTFNRSQQPLYSQFYFSGRTNFNVSLDYNIHLRNFNFFGETALAPSGGIASLNGLLVGLDRKVDLAIIHRNYAANYVALHANAFGETLNVQNERGLYIGLILRPKYGWEWSAYFDSYQHPWLRFYADAPSAGYDWRTRLSFSKRKDYRAYLQVRYETKTRNAANNSTVVDFLSPQTLFQSRLHLSKKISKNLELRSTADFGWIHRTENQTKEQGIVLAQDILYKTSNWTFSGRYALFDTDSYAIRFYYFESTLRNTFSVPAYYDKGNRFYINCRYRGIANMQLEFRYEQTHFRERNSVGSGLNETEGGKRSSVWGQISYRF
ncbi:MAG: helix-hairpin-helix domain-containing protein [Bacteroidota bacterium]